VSEDTGNEIGATDSGGGTSNAHDCKRGSKHHQTWRRRERVRVRLESVMNKQTEMMPENCDEI
ncbi:hypothetical protein A2U01_0090741, partial [Trifolium medium]|nr:hypothetical protein [Trifolium medium]